MVQFGCLFALGLGMIRLVRLGLVMFVIMGCLVLVVSNYGNVLGWCRWVVSWELACGFGVGRLLLVAFGVLRVGFGLGVAMLLLGFWLYG